ncbi:MAG: metal ABC transporter permease [Candidatus Eremiobacteraeota bacterium]|nr:metal ABC transporter permease [Candidatus Eremiobacteraeota bacterium]
MGDPLAQPYLQNALAAGLLVALLSACVGYFVVLRSAAFATHALAQIGFAGAAGAVLLGIDPLVGLIAFAVLGSLGLGAASARSRTSDVVTALVLVAALGTGALFLALAHSYAANVYALLFGTIVGVSRGDVLTIAAASALILLALGVLARPLLFATVARETAQTRGVSVVALDVAFLVLVGLTAAVTVPVVGTLLIYSLAIGPAAAATRLTTRPAMTLAFAFLFAAVAVVAGIELAYVTDWPVGFFIALVTALEYLAARVYSGRES